jgi:hypothetical protein
MAVGVGDLLVLSKLVTSRAPLRSLETRSTGETRSTREERVVLSLLSLETRLERVIRLERRESFIRFSRSRVDWRESFDSKGERHSLL